MTTDERAKLINIIKASNDLIEYFCKDCKQKYNCWADGCKQINELRNAINNGGN